MNPKKIGNTQETPEVSQKSIGHKINMIIKAEAIKKTAEALRESRKN